MLLEEVLHDDGAQKSSWIVALTLTSPSASLLFRLVYSLRELDLGWNPPCIVRSCLVLSFCLYLLLWPAYYTSGVSDNWLFLSSPFLIRLSWFLNTDLVDPNVVRAGMTLVCVSLIVKSLAQGPILVTTHTCTSPEGIVWIAEDHQCNTEAEQQHIQ
ncbi:hypothetical protein L3Q82_010781, partial [Scortum barcoo]